jgi:nitrate/nitrite-specific signal transduction histidine kinase
MQPYNPKSSSGLNWLIVLVMPESDFMQQINENKRNTAILCVIAVAIAGGFGMLTSRWINHSILKLLKATNAMADGNLQHISSISPNTNLQEIDTLAESFNYMAGELRASFANMEQRVQERTVQLQEAKERVEVASQAKSEFLANSES